MHYGRMRAAGDSARKRDLPSSPERAERSDAYEHNMRRVAHGAPQLQRILLISTTRNSGTDISLAAQARVTPPT